MLIKEAIAIALDEMARENSPTGMPTWRSHARKALAYWGEDYDLTTLTRQELQAWINHRQKQVKSATIGHELTFLSRVWRVLEDQGLDKGLQCPISRRLRKPKKNTEKRQIKPEVVATLEELLEPTDLDLVRFALLTFLRRLELFRLKPEHFQIWPDPDGAGHLGKVRVVTSKTGRARTVPLNHQAACIALRRIEATAKAGHTYLFGGQGEDRFAEACKWARRVWRPNIKLIGKGGHFHGLRHRGARISYDNGAPIEATSKMLGHSNIPMTEHYLGLHRGRGLGGGPRDWARGHRTAARPTSVSATGAGAGG